MRAHIQETIQELTAEIARLQNAMITLQRMEMNQPINGGKIEETPRGGLDGVSLLNRIKRPAKPARKESVLSSYVRRGGEGKLKVPRGSFNALGVCLKLAEPFTSIDLCAATGLSKSGASSQILRWFKAGFVEKVGFGEYKRTASFPSGEVSTNGDQKPAPAAKAPAGDRGRIESELKKACQERDRARGAGNEKICDIWQRKIDELERQLEAV